MTYTDIQSALAALVQTSRALEEAYIENGGEITEQTADLEDQKAALCKLLSGEGIDMLGRWLKSKEDEKATWKAEKAACDRHIKALDGTIDFIKKTVGQVLRELDQDSAKGAFYSFSQSVSKHTTVDTEALDGNFLELATEAARNAGLPGFIDVALKTTATRVDEWAEAHDGEGSGYLDITAEPTSKFNKPRKATE